jgi:hypothetical protein
MTEKKSNDKSNGRAMWVSWSPTLTTMKLWLGWGTRHPGFVGYFCGPPLG